LTITEGKQQLNQHDVEEVSALMDRLKTIYAHKELTIPTSALTPMNPHSLNTFLNA
jgi:hypothetical protein